MKTVGERIRQARDARGLSGEELAHAVGYRNQSAISNLENRGTGTGGTKIASIAVALRVPVQWLLAGPDGPDVPFSEPMVTHDETIRFSVIDLESVAREELADYSADGSLTEAMELFRRLDTAQRIKAISYMQYLASEGARASEEGHGNRDTVPHPKAA
jgi:transcriptional regulator with XRE-family HTH domain